MKIIKIEKKKKILNIKKKKITETKQLRKSSSNSSTVKKRNSTSLSTEIPSPPSLEKNEILSDSENSIDGQIFIENQNLLKEKNSPIFHTDFLKYIFKEKSKSINTCSIRMELYVQRENWMNYSILTKNMLYSLILNFKERTEKSKLIDFINFRFLLLNRKESSLIENSLANVKFINFLEDKKIDDLIKKGLGIPAFLINNKKDFSSYNSPLYFINTRDSFAYDLIEKKEVINLNGRKFIKTEFFFSENNYPSNYQSYKKIFPDHRVGVVTYTDFFSHKELKEIEDHTFETEIKCFKSNNILIKI